MLLDTVRLAHQCDPHRSPRALQYRVCIHISLLGEPGELLKARAEQTFNPGR